MEELLTYLKPNSKVSEDFRKLRLNIECYENVKKILITSPGKGEGKTFTSINLAITLARDNKKVLLIDCDFFHNRINEIFNVKKAKGLSNFLQSKDIEGYDKCILKTNIDNLKIIFAGTIRNNSSELLNSKEFKRIINNIESDYDYIIFDSPGILKKADALVLSKIADGVILVAASKQTKIDELKQAKMELKSAQANILGVIVNKENKK